MLAQVVPSPNLLGPSFAWESRLYLNARLHQPHRLHDFIVPSTWRSKLTRMLSGGAASGREVPPPWLALLAWICLLLAPGIAAISLWPWIPTDPGVDSPLAMAVADGSVARAV